VTVLFDTAALSARERPEPWARAHERIFFPIGVRLTTEQPCAGRIDAHQIGPVGAYRVTSDASVVKRSARGIVAFDPEQFLVATSLRGTNRIEQADRATTFAAGELSSWDSSHPFAVTHADPFDLLLIVVPRALLGPRRDAICRHTAQPLDGTLAGPFFRSVWSTLEDGAAAANDDVADALVALVRSLHARAEPRVPALLPQIKAFIDARLGDPRLGPDAIARAHFISTRYLHRIFEREGVSVSEWVRTRRLEACRRDLLDPGLAHESISTIARRWALANPAHFSRAFRAAYGCTPTELRSLQSNGSTHPG
jgi:AraC-like DNA-binding protein